MPHYLGLDVETIPLPHAEDWIEPVLAPDNYKDPVKIEAFIKEATGKQIERCSLDPDLCELAAIGWQREQDEEPVVWTRGGYTESEMLRGLWSGVNARTVLIGFNVLAFDLPILERRSLYLGVTCPTINVDRYRTPHVDLQERFSYRGRLKWRSLDFYARRLNLDLPEDEFKGSDVEWLAEAGRWQDIASHCRSDVAKVMAIARRIGVLKSEPIGAF